MKADLLEVAEPKQELQSADTGVMELFERLARDPNASVEKIDGMMSLFERMQAKKSAEYFNASMSRAQKSMRPVAADATNPQTRSRYASYAALDCALRPIYTDNGFGLSFNTGEAPLPDYVRVLCDVSHIGGHSKTYHLDMPADGKGAKGGDVMTKTHAVGSALSYGMRYLLKMIFNVAVGEDDDDGNMATANAKASVEGPAGYDNWLSDLHAVADTGFQAFEAAWAKSPVAFSKHLASTAPLLLAKLKTKARSAGK